MSGAAPEAPRTCTRTRFEEFDIGRAIALLGLPFVHVLEEGSSLGLFPDGFLEAHAFLLVLSALGAPLFMACLGANIVFSRHSTPRTLARRGVILVLAGAALNIARFGVPDAIFGGISGDHAAATWWPHELAGCDIYDFAGLCFLSFALFKQLRLSPRAILATAAACLVLGAYVLPSLFATEADTYATRLLGRLFWVNENSDFPLLTWLSFPALGYAFGSWFQGVGTDEARTRGLRRMMPAAGAVFLATATFVLVSGGDLLLAYASPANSYITDLPNVLLVGSTLVFVAAVLHWLARALQDGAVLAWFGNMSRGIIPYYTCQWIIIGWLEVAIEDLHLQSAAQMGEASYWAVSLAIVAVCLVVVQTRGLIRARARAGRAEAR